jgi:hypothetical protein
METSARLKNECDAAKATVVVVIGASYRWVMNWAAEALHGRCRFLKR